MLSKISNFQLDKTKYINNQKEKSVAPNYQSNDQLISQNGAKALKSMYLSNVAFKSDMTHTIESGHTIIENIFKFTTTRSFSLPERKGLVPALTIQQERLPSGIKKVKISDATGKTLLIAEKQIGHGSPSVQVGIGKSGFTATLITDPGRYTPESLSQYEGAVMYPGSEIDIPHFKIKLPGDYKIPGKDTEVVSFGNKIVAVEAFKPKMSQKAIDDYFKFVWKKVFGKDMEKLNVVKGEFADEIAKRRNEVDVALTIGGFGTRLDALTRVNGDNKPSLADWTVPGHGLLSYTLDNLVRCGLVDPRKIKEADIIHNVESASDNGEKVGTAGCIVEALHNGALDSSKPAIIVPGDGISDLDISPAIKKFLDNKNVGIMLIGYPVKPSQAEDLGIIAHNEAMEVIQWREKKPAISDEPLANVAIYMMKPEALARIKELYFEHLTKAEGEETASQIKNGNADWADAVIELDFGKDVIPQLMEECSGKTIDEKGNPIKPLLDKDGQQLKMYVEAATGTWADAGKVEEYINTARDMAMNETKFLNLPENIREAAKLNVDPDTGVVFIPSPNPKVNTEELFRTFLGKGTARGNIVIMPRNKLD